ncbi:MAG: SpoVG family protein [Candidatus Omnitrophica bacterium]|nr:SpoVG family protein [Candidatus Omnitrophota bacterium]MCF7877780.1 SpoVG family protein [Candidatus Omnitrophota bacterium]MCF7878787.1 SpoVG family protein [Candidatus Omnitrophota bacterium]MCF7893328.1 SpoVG family protein [Candidatus Omnitrophota bacterium]
MEITEVRISLREHEGRRLKSYATVTFDNSFVVRNIKVIEGNNGLFVAMPARKVKQFCPRCGKKVEMGSKYCSNCGAQIPPPKESAQNRQSIHQDLAHPINQQFRDYLQSKVLDAYHDKKKMASQEEAPQQQSNEQQPVQEESKDEESIPSSE